MQAEKVSRLRGLREAKGMSLAELSKLADIEASSVSRIERYQMPTLGDARALARALGVTVDFLWPEDEQAAS